ncbi:MAG: hypothetical protein ABJ013_07725 [Halioglobus sp.]
MKNSTNNAKSKLRTLVAKASILLAFPLGANSTWSAEVPIDAPRGNYQGAENIHWYQQGSLKVQDHLEGVSLSGSEYVCNQDNAYESCSGQPLNKEQKMYHSQGRVPFVVAIWVDNRETPGFNFAFRRAIREVRRINEVLSRSGVNTQVYISTIESKDLGQFSGDSEEIWDYYGHNESSVVAYARESEADAVMIIRNTEDMKTPDSCGASSQGLSSDTLPIIVLGCVDESNQGDDASALAAHEFGHVLGLGHEYNDRTVTALLNHGYGHHNPAANTNTVMALKKGGKTIPIFSSPDALWHGAYQGSSETANATSALNDAATTAALFYERNWGHLAKDNAESTPENGEDISALVGKWKVDIPQIWSDCNNGDRFGTSPEYLVIGIEGSSTQDLRMKHLQGPLQPDGSVGRNAMLGRSVASHENQVIYTGGDSLEIIETMVFADAEQYLPGRISETFQLTSIGPNSLQGYYSRVYEDMEGSGTTCQFPKIEISGERK